MQLTELLEMYKPIGEVRTKTILELYTGIYDDELDGGLRIRKGSKNTVVLNEYLGEINNTYFHHNRGFGRRETRSVLSDELLDERY